MLWSSLGAWSGHPSWVDHHREICFFLPIACICSEWVSEWVSECGRKNVRMSEWMREWDEECLSQYDREWWVCEWVSASVNMAASDEWVSGTVRWRVLEPIWQRVMSGWVAQWGEEYLSQYGSEWWVSEWVAQWVTAPDLSDGGVSLRCNDLLLLVVIIPMLTQLWVSVWVSVWGCVWASVRVSVWVREWLRAALV
jgi:hypothetical protein